MKLWLIFFISIFSIVKINAQDIEVDNTFFLLGMLDDTHSRIISSRNRTEIEYFSKTDKVANKLFYLHLIKLRNEKFFKEKILVDSTEGSTNIYKNKKIRNYLNSYFKSKQFDWRTVEKYSWKVLDINKIESKKQLYSYLAGAYARNGYSDTVGYHFKFPNSYHKSEFIASLLPKETNGLVELRKCLTCIPNVVVINLTFERIEGSIFKEEEQLKKYLNFIESYR